MSPPTASRLPRERSSSQSVISSMPFPLEYSESAASKMSWCAVLKKYSGRTRFSAQMLRISPPPSMMIEASSPCSASVLCGGMRSSGPRGVPACAFPRENPFPRGLGAVAGKGFAFSKESDMKRKKTVCRVFPAETKQISCATREFSGRTQGVPAVSADAAAGTISALRRTQRVTAKTTSIFAGTPRCGRNQY